MSRDDAGRTGETDRVNGRDHEPLVVVLNKSPAIRDVLTDILQERGYGTILCADEGSALTQLADPATVLAIVDYHLPQMTGPKFLDEMKTRNLDVPVIVLSSPGTADREDTCLDAGAARFFVKPFRVEEVLNTVDEIARRPE